MNYFVSIIENCKCGEKHYSGAIANDKTLPLLIENLKLRNMGIDSKEVISDRLFNYIKDLYHNTKKYDSYKNDLVDRLKTIDMNEIIGKMRDISESEIVNNIKELKQKLGLNEELQEKAIIYAKESFEKDFGVKLPDEFLEMIKELVK